MERPMLARSGTMWTETDYELALDQIKAGAGLEHLAEVLQRKPNAVADKLRRLLPVEQRKCPPDRTVPALALAIADAEYDWRRVVLQTPPEPPVTRIVRSGLSGLDANDLVSAVYALAASRAAGAEDVLNRGLEEVNRRGLDYALMQARARALIQQDSPITMDGAIECARDWLESLREDGSMWLGQGGGLNPVRW